MELGFLRIRQSLEKGEKALVIKDDAIVGLYHAAASELAGDFPPLPQKEVHLEKQESQGTYESSLESRHLPLRSKKFSTTRSKTVFQRSRLLRP
eukprot:2741567-Pleurochrysis_carterae.AAC.1